MFECPGSPPADAAPPSNAAVLAFRESLHEPSRSSDDAQRLERIIRLEELKAAVAAAQALEVAAFVTSRRAVTAAEIAANPVPGVGTRRRKEAAERGIVTDVALARRESPAQASQFMAFALSAPSELPAAFSELAAGKLCEKRMLLLHRSTAWLPAELRVALDAELAPRITEWGDRQVTKEALAAGYRLDPQGACDRVKAAESGRRVSLRPAPEGMTWMSLLLPLVQGVAAWAALDKAAKTAKATGDPRGRGQVMADTAVERLTGQATAAAVPVEVHLVMSDDALLDTGDGADEPARVVGHGSLPAGIGRELVLGDTTAARSIRRLFTDPARRLVAMESTARLFTDAMARFLRVRDDTCRTPWCDAPIAQIDHIRPAVDGGPTSVVNGRGKCVRCNLAEQAAGAVSRPVQRADGSLAVIGITPAGQTYRSQPPDLLTGRGPEPDRPVIDIIWAPTHEHAA